jgi:hypothetical protein
MFDQLSPLLRRFRPAVLGLLALALAPALLAQGTCPAIVQRALAAADDLCAATGRNQACYGHIAVEAVPHPDVTALNFDAAGDIENVTAIQTMRLHPMDEARQTWGVAFMRLQANLPGHLPGQNATFLMFGDVEITSAVPETSRDTFTPMQAFHLRTGLGDSRCNEAPESGLVVQTPHGAGEVIFHVNGVEVAMGSTVLFRAQAGGEMTISTIEGLAVVEVEDEVRAVLAGTRLRVPLDSGLRPYRQLINPPEPYELRNLQGVPLRLLERQVEAAPPLTGEQVGEVVRRVAAGESICGDAPFPSCDRVPEQLLARVMKGSRANCVPRPHPGGPPLPPNERRPFCSDLPPAQSGENPGAARSQQGGANRANPVLPPQARPDSPGSPPGQSQPGNDNRGRGSGRK